MSAKETRLEIIEEGCWQTIGTWGKRNCVKLTECSVCSSCPVYLRAGHDRMSVPMEDDIREDQSSAFEDEMFSTPAGDAMLVVEISQEQFAFPATFAQTVHQASEYHSLHGTNVPLGLVNIDGEIALLIPGNELFSLPSQSTIAPDQRMFVRLFCENEKSVIEVDRVLGVIRISPSDVRDIPFNMGQSRSTAINGCISIKGKTIAIVNLEQAVKCVTERIR